MSAEENKQLVLSWFDAGMNRETERWLDLIHDDFRWYIAGSMPISGWHDKTRFLEIGELLARHLSGPFTIKIGDITAEEDRVIVEAEGDAELSNGKRYNNFYLWTLRVRDAKIVEFKEFTDTLHLYDTFDIEEVRGEPKQRVSPVEHVRRTLGVPLSDLTAGPS